MAKSMLRIVGLSAALVLGIGGCGDGDEGAAGNGGSAGTGGAAGAGGSAGTGGAAGAGGGIEETIHSCTPSIAMDLTGMPNVNITDISNWTVPHQACIRIDVGTQVTWDGNFSAHPLAGGVSPIADEASPITAAEATSGTASATVSFVAEGTFPYFCQIHNTTMQGVIYVVP